jgi:tRNA-specific 2-thiouridylase
MSARPRVVVAMSGGVDSSTAAALLCEQGVEVVGVTLRLYDASGTSASLGGRCCGPRDIEDARATAAALGFAHYVLDESEAFSAGVIADFVDEYRAGRTPNPCVRCNEKLKFGPLVRFARAVGAEALATGHYARLDPAGDGVRLRRAVDREKDQAYFLFAVTPSLLPFVRFPLGEMTKDQVRAEARRLRLPNCDKPDSQQICFIPDGNHKAFLDRHGGAGPAGDIVDEQGRVMGGHPGTHHFTVGQRKGLPAEGGADPRFVVRIDVATGRVHVGPRSLLGRQELRVEDARWLGAVRAGDEPLACDVQIRHHAAAHAATLTMAGDGVHVRLAAAVDGVAPGQAAVFFRGDEVLGGGWIA